MFVRVRYADQRVKTRRLGAIAQKSTESKKGLTVKHQAIATLTLGESVQQRFSHFFRDDWERYCRNHNLDLVIIKEPLDVSPRAKLRNPAWQKCLIYRSPQLCDYAQIAWVDADIKIRPDSPNIFTAIPVESVGAVDDYATPTLEDHDIVLKRLYQEWEIKGVKYVQNMTPQAYHENFGLKGAWKSVVQTGVLVFSPSHHAAIFQKVYDNYEEKKDAAWNYEMRPLSHELLSSGCIRWMSPKFNMTWSLYEKLFYPFLAAESGNISIVDRLRRRLLSVPFTKLRKQCVETAFQNNYFLHFAGGSTDYQYLQ